MDKYRKYYGVIVFLLVVVLALYSLQKQVFPKLSQLEVAKSNIVTSEATLQKKRTEERTVRDKLKKIENAVASLPKKVYAPIESDLGNDTLFFTLYNDVIEMLHSNSVRIKSIDYQYNPEEDKFVQHEKDVYFVCDVNMELVSNYTNLGKLIENIQQYPYYIKINKLDVKPYPADKKILLTKMSLRLYAKTEPESVD